MTAGICLSIEDVGLTLIERRNSGIRDKSYADVISAKYHLRPDIAQAYVDAVVASGAVGAKCMDRSKFIEYMGLCKMFVEKYLEFFENVYGIVRDESARRQLQMNCPMLLRICDSISRTYWVGLEEVFGLTPLESKFCFWSRSVDKNKKQSIDVPSEPVDNELPINNPVFGKDISALREKRANAMRKVIEKSNKHSIKKQKTKEFLLASFMTIVIFASVLLFSLKGFFAALLCMIIGSLIVEVLNK